MGAFLNMNISSCFLVIALELFLSVEIYSSNSCDLDIENTLRTLLTQDKPSIQVRALRRELLKKLIEELEEEIQNESKGQTISPTSNNLPYEMKRNLEALARAGYIRTLPDEDDSDGSYKRSIANLAKNGQLPNFQNDKEKRGLESLARNGDLHPRSNARQLLEDIYGKRNIASLARGYNFPVYGKKSISSLARSGELPYSRSQRNTDAVERDVKNNADKIHKQKLADDKKSLQSIKAQMKPKITRSIDNDSLRRNKREASDYYYTNEEFPSPVYQSQNVFDYDDLMQELAEADIDKRFLGRLPQMGKSKPTPTPRTQRFL